MRKPILKIKADAYSNDKMKVFVEYDNCIELRFKFDGKKEELAFFISAKDSKNLVLELNKKIGSK